ncbi:hypothetical protein [Dyadobacter sediminis]|uniref:Lipocalin-like domain-containing protein n=1 Tax=Dyadobacter sediminis TaxID=1493691 RepID=A0A5R9K7F5_9BACT|nr:hypothetical protein [Dyadobacter sediminis]TLU89805.1 hypothetical protein FEM55_19920 [Dyadobacter sediminis]GGC12670.1 hypothetical protein GCM10011325_44400 [Dyadobacter sediminis]
MKKNLKRQEVRRPHLLFFALLLSALFVACDKKDKDAVCVAPSVEKNLIGLWDALLMSDEGTKYVLEFKSDGSYTESNGLLFGTDNSPVNAWKIQNDSIFLTSKYNNQTAGSYTFPVLTNTCEKVVFDMEGIDKLILTRKK